MSDQIQNPAAPNPAQATTTPTPAPALVPGTPEYDAAMIAKAESAEAASQPARPEWLPQKFTSPEDLAAAYAELEKKLGKTDDQPPADPNATPADPAQATPEAAAEAVQKAGFDMAALETEFAEKGALTDETYAKLAEAGWGKEVVDGYIAGQQAIATQMRADILSGIGGEAVFEQISSWAGSTLPEAEITAINQVMDSGTPEAIKLALAGLKARYESTVGRAPKLLLGEAAAPTAGGFQSRAEMTAMMGDPRYQKDPAFRAQVERKLAATTAF